MPKHMTAPEKKNKNAIISAGATGCRSKAYRDRATKIKIHAPER